MYFSGLLEILMAFDITNNEFNVCKKRSNLIILEKSKIHIIGVKVQNFLQFLIRYKYTSSIDGVINSMSNIGDSR